MQETWTETVTAVKLLSLFTHPEVIPNPYKGEIKEIKDRIFIFWVNYPFKPLKKKM